VLYLRKEYSESGLKENYLKKSLVYRHQQKIAAEENAKSKKKASLQGEAVVVPQEAPPEMPRFPVRQSSYSREEEQRVRKLYEFLYGRRGQCGNDLQSERRQLARMQKAKKKDTSAIKTTEKREKALSIQYSKLCEAFDYVEREKQYISEFFSRRF